MRLKIEKRGVDFMRGYKTVKGLAALLLAGMLAVTVFPAGAAAREEPTTGENGEQYTEQITEKDISGSPEGTIETIPQEQAEIEEAPANDTEVKKEAPEETVPPPEEVTGEGGENGQEGEAGDGSGEVPQEPVMIELQDPATGIIVKAEDTVIPAGTILAVTPIQSGQEYELLKMLLSVSAEQFSICNISLVDMSTGSPVIVQPQGSAQVSIPVPEGYDTERLAVWSISADGQKTEIAFTIENGAAVFQTDYMGVYAVAQKKEEQGGSVELPPSLEPTDKVERLELNKAYPDGVALTSGFSMTDQVSPKTGDNSQIVLWGVVLVAAAAAVVAVIIIGKKRK